MAHEARRLRLLRLVAVVVVFLVPMTVVARRLYERSAERRRDIRAAEAILRRFPPPPGSAETGREVETLKSEKGHVFGHNLQFTYRLPMASRPPEVFKHYDGVTPSGWRVADNHDCQRLTLTTAGPQPAPGFTPATTGALFISAPRSQRFYTDGSNVVWVRVSRGSSGSVQLAISNRQGPANCTQAPDGGPDPEADAFG